MPEIFLTSDLHLGREYVASTRGFDDVADHDLAIIAGLAQRVRSDDELFILGDVAMGGRNTSLPLLNQIPGRKHLIVGNHDRVFAGNRNAHNYLREYLRFFQTVQPFAVLRRYGQTYLLSHFPYDGEGTRDMPDRHTQFRLRDEGQVLLHGHTHENRVVSYSRAGTMQIHVGVDAHGLKPITLFEAEQFAATQAHLPICQHEGAPPC